MTQIFTVACNGCGAESRPENYMTPVEGWHLYETKGLLGEVCRLDICPACFADVPLSRLMPEAVEAKLEAKNG